MARAQDANTPVPSAPVAPAAPAAPATPAANAPASPPAPASEGAIHEEVEALREEVRSLKAQVDAAPAPPGRVAPPPAPASVVPPSPPRPLGYEPFWPWATPPEGISVGGYLQSQYVSSQASQNQLQQGGAPLNKDRFLIRRARVSLLGEWEYAAIALEIDGNTTSGPQVDLRKAEASLQYRPDRTKPPLVMVTLGQFDTPFGYELVESPRTRWFMERSTASQAFWPGEPDLGVRFAGALGFFRWTIAALNGEPLGESSPYTLQDPNSAKDVVFRFGFDTTPMDTLHLAGGLSSLRGTGFHPGTDATKSQLQWNDVNDDGSVSISELSPIPGRAATASQNFDRWTVGADLRAELRWVPGVAKVYGEFMLGSNMDRGQYVADPITAKIDQRELGFYVGATQEIARYGFVGFRYDFYDPNSNAFDSRQGRLIPLDQATKTFSPLVGLTLPERARLVFQYDFVHNALARDPVGVPTNLKSNAWTLRLQVQL